MKYESNYTKNELTLRWDDITSPARFAGANDQNDWIYNSTRKGDKVKLVKKPRLSYDPYATVFRGKITDGGITGVYTKGVFDYVITAFLAGIYYGVCAELARRAEDKTAPVVFMILGLFIIFLALYVFPGKKKKYGELIKKVTEGDGSDMQIAPQTEEATENSPALEEKEEKKENKYKFRFLK